MASGTEYLSYKTLGQTKGKGHRIGVNLLDFHYAISIRGRQGEHCCPRTGFCNDTIPISGDYP